MTTAYNNYLFLYENNEDKIEFPSIIEYFYGDFFHNEEKLKKNSLNCLQLNGKLQIWFLLWRVRWIYKIL